LRCCRACANDDYQHATADAASRYLLDYRGDIEAAASGRCPRAAEDEPEDLTSKPPADNPSDGIADRA
jgi:hypothetical protein